MFALERGERLRLDWLTPGPTTARVSVAPANYSQSAGVLYDGFGDAVFDGPLADGNPALLVAAPTTGWYKLSLRAAAGVVVEPCIE
jgi:hypothetical protein